MIKVAEILDSEKRWVRGTFSTPDDSKRCLMGALIYVDVQERLARGLGLAAGLGLAEAHAGLACDAIETVTGARPLTAISWNDAPERTFEEVHAVACEIDRLRMLRGEG